MQIPVPREVGQLFGQASDISDVFPGEAHGRRQILYRDVRHVKNLGHRPHCTGEPQKDQQPHRATQDMIWQFTRVVNVATRHLVPFLFVLVRLRRREGRSCEGSARPRDTRHDAGRADTGQLLRAAVAIVVGARSAFNFLQHITSLVQCGGTAQKVALLAELPLDVLGPQRPRVLRAKIPREVHAVDNGHLPLLAGEQMGLAPAAYDFVEDE
mmetsp:Transcript_113808/g.361716  ORF Transcript_113808/g.361716 Transcript_113808/m.361716 type:complete len:212 (-) Transcript_113808:1638-2273(-)